MSFPVVLRPEAEPIAVVSRPGGFHEWGQMLSSQSIPPRLVKERFPYVAPGKTFQHKRSAQPSYFARALRCVQIQLDPGRFLQRLAAGLILVRSLSKPPRSIATLVQCRGGDLERD